MDRKAQGLNTALLLFPEKLCKTLTSHIGIRTPSKMADVQWPVQCHTGEVITSWSLWMDGVSRSYRCTEILGPVLCSAQARSSWEWIFQAHVIHPRPCVSSLARHRVVDMFNSVTSGLLDDLCRYCSDVVLGNLWGSPGTRRLAS